MPLISMSCDDCPVALEAPCLKTVKHFGAIFACRIRNALLVSFYEKEDQAGQMHIAFLYKGSFNEQYPKLQRPRTGAQTASCDHAVDRRGYRCRPVRRLRPRHRRRWPSRAAGLCRRRHAGCTRHAYAR
ncbi:hypothetical protein EMIT0P12_40157 [Pseudomonas sp. IT-P12]